jgi:hypothetical protein
MATRWQAVWPPWSLSAHVRSKLDALGDALSLELRESDRILLADLLCEHDTLSHRVHDFARHIDEALAPYAEQCRLLETLPGPQSPSR